MNSVISENSSLKKVTDDNLAKLALFRKKSKHSPVASSLNAGMKRSSMESNDAME